MGKPLGGFVQYYEPETNAKTQSIEAAIEAGVAAFETHEKNVLAVLRNAYERGPKSEPFERRPGVASFHHSCLCIFLAEETETRSSARRRSQQALAQNCEGFGRSLPLV